MKINTILFDLDGTLVDSNELILESFRRTFLHYFPERNYSKEKLLEMMGPPLYETFSELTKVEETIQEMIDFYRKVYVEIEFDYVTLYPYTLEMLSYFKNKGYNLGIVTTKFMISAVPSIKAFHIDDYVNVVISLDEVKNHKPHPEPVLTALKRFSHVEMAVMVGDNYTDLESGKAAGILTCGLEWSLKKESLKETNPTFWIHSFEDFVKQIEQYNKEES